MISLTVQEMCDTVVDYSSYMLYDIPDCFNTQDMCIKVLRRGPRSLPFVPDRFKTQEMCNETDEESLYTFGLSPIILKRKRCTLKVLKKTRGSCAMYLISIRQGKCAIRQ